MSYGFLAINGANLVQIDQDYSNLAAVDWVVAPPEGLAPSGRTLHTNFVRPQNDFCTGIYLNFIGSGVINRFVSRHWATGAYAGFDLWRAGPANLVTGPSAATHGLRVFRADGSIAFDSGHYYVRPVATFNLPWNGVKHVFSLPSSSWTRCISTHDLAQIWWQPVAAVGWPTTGYFCPVARFINNDQFEIWIMHTSQDFRIATARPQFVPPTWQYNFIIWEL